MSAQVWEFLPPTSPCPSLSTFGWSRPPPVRADTRLALFETLQLKNNSHWRVKKLIILFENNVRMKTIFEMMSFHCVPHILYWIQAEWKFYIQTYRQIIWVNFTNMVAIIFFQSGRPHLAKPPLPLPLSAFVHFCLTSTPLMCTHPLWMARVHDCQLIQEVCILLLAYYMGLCIGRSKKEATVRFFRRAF